MNTKTRLAQSIALLLFAALAHADALVDPTRPANAPTKSTSNSHAVAAAPRVTAIFVAGSRRVAVFDGRVVHAGDHFGDIAIQEILTDGVRLTRAGHVEVVRLPKQATSVRSDARKESIEERNP